MNKIFRFIWSKAKGHWITIYEIITAKDVRMPAGTGALWLTALFLTAAPAMAIDPNALPTGGTISSGSGNISTNGNLMKIKQNSQRMVANWDTFNVGSNAGVNFNQPNSSATALNRIQDQNPSRILGSLSANGQVFLINPSGIIFGASATVNVGGLVASTLDISDENFINGNFTFTNGGSAGTISNAGTINAEGGYIAFLAPVVENSGIINANGDTVAIAAGDKVSLDLSGDGLITFTVDQGAIDAQIENQGLIRADGGTVLLTAKAADELTSAVVNNSGIIEAKGLASDGGRIMLLADDGQTTISGTLDASSENGTGGTVIATGDTVRIESDAHLTASGTTGGGEVLVGGSWQGSDDTIIEATKTVVQSGAYLEANATLNGNGGTVVAWSDVNNETSETSVHGTLEAQGGSKGGDGGRIETSGHSLDIIGSNVSAGAPAGTGGLWLLDPTDAVINQAVADTYATTLNSGTDVTNTVTGNIITSGNVSLLKNAGGDATLTLEATGYIALVDGSYIGSYTKAAADGYTTTIQSTSSALNIVINPDSDGNSTGGFWLPSGSSILTNGGDITIGGGAAASGFAVGVAASSYEWNSLMRGVAINGTLSAQGGNITIKGQGATESGVSAARGVHIAGTVSTTGTGSISITGTPDGGSAGIGMGDTSSYNLGSGSISTEDGDITLIANNVSGTAFQQSLTTSLLQTTGSGNLSLTSNGPFQGTGIFDIGGTTTLTAGANDLSLVNSSNDFTGAVSVVSANSVSLQDSNNLVLGDSTVSGDFYATAAGSVTSSSNITLNGGNLIVDAALPSTLSGIISGSGGLQTTGAGLLNISNENNTFTGNTTIDSGSSLAITDNFGQSLSSSAHIQNSGTLIFSNSNAVGTIQSIAGSGNIQLNTSTVTIENNNGEVSGTISGSGGITLNGGDLILSGTNSFDGLLTVNTATLTARHSSALGSTSNGTTISQGATLILEGDINIADPLSVAGTGVGGTGAIINRGTNTLSGTITLVGADVEAVSESGTLTFTNTINGAFGFTLTGNGEVSIQGEVGGETPLLFLDADAGDTTYIGADITTLGEQTYRNQVAATNNIILQTVGSEGANLESIAAGLPTSAYSISYGSSPATETVDKAFDGSVGTKYLNHYGEDTDVLIEGSNPYIVTGLKLTTANDAYERDPTSFTLYGSNTSTTADMVEIASGTLSPPTTRYTDYPEVTFANSTAYTYYRLVFNTLRNTAVTDDVQISRIYLPGTIPTTGDITPNITFADAVTAGGNLSIDAIDDININAGITVNGNLSLSCNNAITQSAEMVVGGTTSLDAGTNDIILVNTNNDFSGTVSVLSGQNVSIIDADTMTLGGVSAGGTLDIATLTGDLTLTGAVSTTDDTENAVKLNAGKNTTAGTATGGNIIVSGGSVSTGAGGRATLYTGSVSGSSGLTALVGSGSSNFRYNSDESLTNFTAALGSGNYAIYREQPTLTITADDETITYGNTPTLSTTISGLVNGDDEGDTISTDATVSVGGSNSTSGFSISGTHALSPSGAANDFGYAIQYAAGTLTVNTKALTLSGITAEDKLYDGTTDANVDASAAIYSGLVSGDALSVSATGTFSDKNAGNNKTVNLNSSYSGADAGNYTITDQDETTANISPKTLSVSGITAENKTYDGTTDANVDTAAAVYSGLVSGDTLSVSATGTFSDKNAGNNKTVDLNSSYSGADTGNYTITDQDETTANISPKTLSVSGITAENKTYDGTTDANVDTAAAVYSGLVSGDTLSVSATGTFSDKNAGNNKTVDLNSSYSGADTGNYTITDQDETTANILPKTLSVSGITAENKTYDGTTDANVDTAAAIYSGLVSGDVLSVSATGTFSDKNAGNNKTVNLNNSYSGADAGNYTITDQDETTANISPKTLSVSGITAENKTYDGTTDANVDTAAAIYSGLVSGDALSVSASGTFSDKNAGNNKTVDLNSSYSGADAGNYAITDQDETTANISPKTLSVSGITAENKTYDGTTDANVDTAAAIYSGLLSGDALSVSATGTFSDKNAGNNKTVNLNSSYSGADAGNYAITDQNTTTAHILQAALAVTANDDSTTYDGSAYSGGNGVIYSGFATGEDSSVLGGTLAYGGDSQGAVQSGEYTIAPSGFTSDNYAITYLDGTLTIEENRTTDTVINNSLEQEQGNGNETGTGASDTTIITDNAGSNASGLINLIGGTDTTITLASDTSVETATFSTNGDTVTLSSGEQDNRTMTEIGLISVFSQSTDGNVEARGGYVVSENTAATSLTSVSSGTDVNINARNLDNARHADFSLTTTDGAIIDLTASVTADGVLIISGSDGIAGMNQDQVVLMGLQIAKQELNIELGRIKAIVLSSK
nr:YDG domain-containing protein [uncultured Desulfobacter sp.]